MGSEKQVGECGDDQDKGCNDAEDGVAEKVPRNGQAERDRVIGVFVADGALCSLEAPVDVGRIGVGIFIKGAACAFCAAAACAHAWGVVSEQILA